MNERTNGNASDGGVELRQGKNVFVTLRTDQLSFVRRIISLGYERQCGIRGAVVNVPISVPDTVSVVPRTFDSTHVIQVHLKRKLEAIRPARLIQAVQYLVNTELYRKHNISFDGDWLNQMGAEEEIPFIADKSDREVVEELPLQHSHSQ